MFWEGYICFGKYLRINRRIRVNMVKKREKSLDEILKDFPIKWYDAKLEEGYNIFDQAEMNYVTTREIPSNVEDLKGKAKELYAYFQNFDVKNDALFLKMKSPESLSDEEFCKRFILYGSLCFRLNMSFLEKECKKAVEQDKIRARKRSIIYDVGVGICVALSGWATYSIIMDNKEKNREIDTLYCKFQEMEFEKQARSELGIKYPIGSELYLTRLEEMLKLKVNERIKNEKAPKSGGYCVDILYVDILYGGK